MKEEPKHFHQVAFETLLRAQWGKRITPELMSAIDRLEQAEEFAAMDFETLEITVLDGEGKPTGEEPTGECWNREWAVANLHAAREAYRLECERIEETSGWRDAPQVIADHVSLHKKSRQTPVVASPQVSTIMQLAVFLVESGAIPSAKVIENMIVALKELDRVRNLPAEEKKQQNGNALLHTILRAVDLCATGRLRRRISLANTRRFNPAKPCSLCRDLSGIVSLKKQWNGQLGELAKRIRKLDLFPNKNIQVDEWVKRHALPLTPENERSSIFDGILYAGKVPND